MNALYWVCLVGVLVLATVTFATRDRSPRFGCVSSVAAMTLAALAALLLMCGVR